MRPTASCFLLLLVAAAMSLASQALQLRPMATGACVPRERDALLAFKKGITKDPLGRLASWRRGEDCCRWRGVLCSNRTGGHHVIRLRLATQLPPWTSAVYEQTVLVGQITPSLLSLEHLEHLDLSSNSLEGPTSRFPEFLGSLKSLRYLNLSGIPFTGTLPPQLGNLSNLHYLDLSGIPSLEFRMLSTDLSWVTNLPSLHYLNLNWLDLSTAVDWPHIVNMIPSLRVLYLSFCDLQSANQSLPHLNLTKLEKLDLSHNSFDQPSASCWFWNLTSLKHLDLHYSYLYGQFPYALGDMTSLQVFDYSLNFDWGNKCGTAIMAPNLLRNLCNLEVLNLYGSLSSGNITELFESLSHCPSKKMRELDLAYNNITGTVPTGMAQFTSLVRLDLSDNKLTGTLPTGMGQFTSLVTLDLYNNKLTGPVPSEITMLTNLTSMDLSRNDLNGAVTEEHFAGLHSLKFIDLSHNHLKIAVGPEWLPPFRPESISFASCQLGPQFPAWLQRLAGTSRIDISSNGITGQLPDWFSTVFSKTTYLDFSNNGISGCLPTNMETMSLNELYLGSNKITGQIPPLPRNLTYLSFLKNTLSGHVTKSICKSQGLRFLDLTDNLLEGEFPQCSGMKNLTYLFLRNNRFSGKFPSFLQDCSNLAFLDLSRNNFSRRLPTWIGDLMGLEYLQLSYNTFYGNIPSSIYNLTYIYVLNLAGNRFSGIIPWHLSNLTTMQPARAWTVYDASYEYNFSVVTKQQELYYGQTLWEMFSIDLSSNCLTGGIPEGIASLAFINLNLSRNYLSGKIPDKIGAMQSLESLDLSRNKLSGEIPSSLSNLTYLSCLDLSYNNLSGRIPSGSQLDTLYVNNPYMYSGNYGLCGPPLQRNCLGGIASKQGDGDHNRTTALVPEPMLFYLGLVSGFVLGLWVVFCVMLFMKTWRIAYFRFFDKVYDKIYVFVAVTWASLAQKTTAH